MTYVSQEVGDTALVVVDHVVFQLLYSLKPEGTRLPFLDLVMSAVLDRGSSCVGLVRFRF